jgi:hypothetical protein
MEIQAFRLQDGTGTWCGEEKKNLLVNAIHNYI